MLALLQRAVALGANFIDTADMYGAFVSEEIIAEALHPYAPGVVIGTKGGLVRFGPGGASTSTNCTASTRRYPPGVRLPYWPRLGKSDWYGI
jgi:aryl-alcohol dehydrogenase-like predicted oxidoreductase